MKGRVIQVVEDLKIGGMERVLQSAAALARAGGLESKVICTRAGGAVADELTASGIAVEVMRNARFLSLARRLRGEAPVVVHSHGAAGTMARLAGRLAGAAGVIHHVHGTQRYSLKHRLFERASPADRYLCVSRFVKEDFEKQTWAARAEVLYNPVDAGRFQFSGKLRRDCRGELGIPDGRPVVLCVGRFAPDKGQGALLEAAARVLAACPEALFVFVGDGPARAEAERRSSGLGRAVRFLGERADVVPFLCACDVFVQPSLRREALGIASLEALACERAVVASSIEGLPEAVGDAGVLVGSGDAAAIGAAVLDLIEHPARRSELGRRGRERVLKNFSAAETGKRLLEIYREFLG